MSLEVLIAHEDARASIVSALKLPERLGEYLIAYVALFRPPERQLAYRRVAAILGELHPMIRAAQIERNGRTWPAPIEYWRVGIEAMLAKRDEGKLQLPLKSHGYLLEIIAGHAHAAEGRAEAKREQERAYAYSSERRSDGPAPAARAAGVDERAPMPPETRAAMDRILGRASKEGS